MKKFLTLVVALAMVIPTMAIGRNDGSTKANAIDFDWDAPMTHTSGTLWYRVDLAPLYEEESPALNLFLANKDAFNETHTSLKATVAGQTDEKSFTIAPKQQKVWSANATMLVRMKQKEIYLTLTSDGEVMMSARVFEAEDLDETCKDALTFNWTSGITKPAGVKVWYRVNIQQAKANTAQDVCVVVTNNGTDKLTLNAGQSLDCPSSGTTTRTVELEAGQTLRDTVPNSMLNGVAYDELYVSLENDQPITITAEYADRPAVPVLPATTDVSYQDVVVPDTSLHTMDTMDLSAGVTYYLRYTVSQLNALKKYEPEFTYLNPGTEALTLERKMAFEVPAYVAEGRALSLEAGEESVEVLSKNTLVGLDAEYIYIKLKADKDMKLISRFKHVREGKACKTNIDFDWVSGHTQEANTNLWYAVDLTDAKANTKDVVVYILNTDDAKATVNASMAFSCPYIDLQEISRSVAAGDTAVRRLAYSTYAMMSDTVWIGLQTDKSVKFWAEMVDAEKNAVVDTICQNAVDFDWDNGVVQTEGDTVWYRIDMQEVRDQAAKFPTIAVQNLSSTNAVTITGELSLECPDSIANESRTINIAAGAEYTKQLSRNLFENITADTVYLKVITTQDISIQIRLTEEAEGASCSSAIPFNWVSGNSQAANANLWYSVDLREVMKRGNDIRVHLLNKDNASGKGVIQLAYECPVEAAPSVRNFTITAQEEKTATIQNTTFEMIEDSMIYINLQGTNAMRFWADTLPVADFDTITGEGLTLTPLYWDTLYTQAVDTAWYIVPQSEIEKIKNMEEKVKPVAHLINLDAQENTYKAEAAFAFPIVKNMMTKSQKLSAGQHFSDTIPSSTFDQFLKKDSIIIRVIRPAGSAQFQFRAELVGAFGGNTRADAIPIVMDKQYTQSPNTEMWYKINTADLKKDKTLFNKSLFVSTKNAGQGDALVNVAAYEGLLSEVDLLEEYGLSDYRERTIKKGQGKSHDVPAQAVYGLGDIELYIKVRTTDSLVFESKFNGEYAAITPDPKQQEAKLLTPNVEYVVPGDNAEHWYMVCLPYMQNNYIYTDSSKLEYELNGTATIEVTATFQDTMDCKMPVRTRTINKAGGVRKGSKPVRELIERALKKTGHTFDFSGTDDSFIDSLLHRFITKDSIVGYVRIKTDNDLKVKLIMPQVTGDECVNPMMFDWEHGNVNPKGATTWYQVKLDSLVIPDTCDLRLHVDNWGETDNTVTADMYFDCNDPKTSGKSYTIPAAGKDSIDIDRDLLVQLGWADLLINYTSSETSHIWAELIPPMARDTLRDTIVAYVCQGDDYLDTITNITHGPIDYSVQWYDTVTFQDGVVMKDSITLFDIHPLVIPEALTVDSMKKLGAAPLLVQGMQLFVDSSSVKLTEYYRQLAASVDTITAIDTVYWAEPVYKSSGTLNTAKEAALDLTSYYSKTDTQDTLLLVIKSDTCDFIYRTDIVFPIEDFKYVTKSDTICPPAPAVNPDTLACQAAVADTLGRLRYIDTIVTYVARVAPTLYTQDEILLLPTVTNGAAIKIYGTIESLLQQFVDDDDAITMDVTDAKWQVFNGTTWQDLPYTVSATATTVSMRYIITTECATNDTSAYINFSLSPVICVDTYGEEYVTECGSSYTWNGTSYTASGDYIATLTNAAGCDSIVTLHLVLNQPTASTETVSVCESYTWQGNTYTVSGTYFDTIPNAVGCDSVMTLVLTINQPTASTETVSACVSYTWHGTTYTTSGTYLDTIPNAVGCDSVMTLVLTINQPTYSDEYVTNCGSYTWHGTTYTTGGDYTWTTTNAAGCDSIITLHLVINQSSSSVETVSTCDSYTWNGVTYTESGTYTYNTTNAAGCDSIATLNLTILKSTAETLSAVEACESYYWTDADMTITTSGNYTWTTTNVAGCDSVVTLPVTIHNAVATTKPAETICNYYVWTEADTTIVTSGTYTHVFQTVHGCDSVVTFDVTINVPYNDTLTLVHKYGDRLIMIDRNEINAIPGWYLDSLDVEHPEYVSWYEIDPSGNERKVGEGYYYNLTSGEPLPSGYTYYAVVNIPGDGTTANCGAQGTTEKYTIPAQAAAPALMPTLAHPGETINVLNLDPSSETTIRVYTADGILVETYKVNGESTYTISAARQNGFYLVELSGENMQHTLRYIVK